MTKSNAKPLVSVIMPARNAGRYIASAIQSVVDQTYDDWELVVVDDDSQDDTRQIVKSFTDCDRRIKYQREVNLSPAKSRNSGIRNSSGELVAFLDADDLWITDKLRSQVETLSNTGSGLVFSSGFYFSDEDFANESNVFVTKCGSFSGPEWFKIILLDNPIPVLSVVVKRTVLERVGCFNEHPDLFSLEDVDLWLNLARSGVTFYGMSDRLVRYRIHSAGISKDLTRHMEAHVAMLKRHAKSSYMSELMQNDKDFQLAVGNKIKELQRDVGLLCLDRYPTLIAAGQYGKAVPYYVKAVKYCPRTLLSPRPFARSLKYLILSLGRSAK